jgi:flavorubredoxin
MVTELKKGVYWVGVVDWNLRRFHGHELSTHRGSTHNSYLIRDEKTVLVDTVWEPFAEQLIEEHLQKCGITLVREGLHCKWQPRAEELDACRAFGRELAATTRGA